jgi:hypothetical protein
MSEKMTPPSDGCYNCGSRVRTWKRSIGWYCYRCAPSEYVVQGVPIEERRYHYSA